MTDKHALPEHVFLINKDELSFVDQSYEFEGKLYGGVKASIILVDAPPGEGVQLHQHPYEEIFIVQEGQATYTVGTTDIAVKAGQIVVVPANTPHKFVNSGEDRLKQTDIHLSDHFITIWLEAD